MCGRFVVGVVSDTHDAALQHGLFSFSLVCVGGSACRANVWAPTLSHPLPHSHISASCHQPMHILCPFSLPPSDPSSVGRPNSPRPLPDKTGEFDFSLLMPPVGTMDFGTSPSDVASSNLDVLMKASKQTPQETAEVNAQQRRLQRHQDPPT